MLKSYNNEFIRIALNGLTDKLVKEKYYNDIQEAFNASAVLLSFEFIGEKKIKRKDLLNISELLLLMYLGDFSFN